MQDATGQVIGRQDLVRLDSPAAACPNRNNYGIVLRGLPGRKVVVQCLDGTVATENARDVRVADRSFFRPGMAVVLASDRAGQLGVVTDAAVELDLARLSSDGDESASEEVATGVSPSELRRVREFGLGDYVVARPWLGRVFEVSLDADVMFDDGGICRVTRADGGKLRPVSGDFLKRSTNSVFYPGQRVVAGGGSSVFKASRWLKGYWKPSHGEGTVSKVEIAAVFVHWVASSLLETRLISTLSVRHARHARHARTTRTPGRLGKSVA